MASAPCLDTFETAPEDQTRATVIDVAHPDCACENEQVSRYCADPVSREETLARLVLDPTHIEIEDGKTRLKTSFFSDAASFGASCLRKERAEAGEYVKTIEDIFKNSPVASDGKNKSLIGVVLIKVDDIKSEASQTKDKKGNVVDSFTAFCVYATGLDGRPNHADVMANRLSKISRSQANRAGINLTKKINDAIAKGGALVSVSEFKAIADLSAWATQP